MALRLKKSSPPKMVGAYGSNCAFCAVIKLNAIQQIIFSFVVRVVWRLGTFFWVLQRFQYLVRSLKHGMLRKLLSEHLRPYNIILYGFLGTIKYLWAQLWLFSGFLSRDCFLDIYLPCNGLFSNVFPIGCPPSRLHIIAYQS